jgi:phosphopantothenoylcysteine decarboxylase/phosphopantothenate--cysteine ligase
VADYTPVPRRGKIASSQDKLVVSMVPTPKVIDRLHQIAPEAILVAFKLESGLTREELLARAGSTMARAGARFVVANLLAGHGCENHGAILLDSNDKTEELPTRRGLAERLIQRLEEEVRK